MARAFLHLAVSFDLPKMEATRGSPHSSGVAATMRAMALMGTSDPIRESQQAIEKELDQAKDWIRYAPNCWLIYSVKNADVWYKRLIEIPGMKDTHTFLICEINVENRAGWLPFDVWDWIDKKRSQATPRLPPR